ncbi:class IV adenylate cyclase [Candidatus Woesearchaeota archaeon]|nr:class IV adenylate cyclase [Candidatus Woesearchaeota archaeon]
MQEHEVKILEIDESQILKRLQELNAKLIFDGELNSRYYDFSDDVLRRSGRMLRLRKKGNSSFLTLKIPQVDHEMKINTEHEIEVGDFETMRTILVNLGFIEFSKDARKRKSYRIDGATIELNKYENIPPFLEIEAESKEKLKQALFRLGFSMADTKAWSGKDVLKHYEK